MSRLSCPTPLVFSGMRAGNWRIDLLNVKGSAGAKEQKPRALIPDPALSHWAIEASMLACSCLAVFTCWHLLSPSSWATNSEVPGVSNLSASVIYLLPSSYESTLT